MYRFRMTRISLVYLMVPMLQLSRLNIRLSMRFRSVVELLVKEMLHYRQVTNS